MNRAMVAAARDAGWSHPLQDYVAALGTAGLAVVALLGPRAGPPPWDRMPLFLWINAVHRP